MIIFYGRRSHNHIDQFKKVIFAAEYRRRLPAAESAETLLKAPGIENRHQLKHFFNMFGFVPTEVNVKRIGLYIAFFAEKPAAETAGIGKNGA